MNKVIEVKDEYTVYCDDEFSLNDDVNFQLHARVPGHDEKFVTATAIMEVDELRALRDRLNTLLGE